MKPQKYGAPKQAYEEFYVLVISSIVSRVELNHKSDLIGEVTMGGASLIVSVWYDDFAPLVPARQKVWGEERTGFPVPEGW